MIGAILIAAGGAQLLSRTLFQARTDSSGLTYTVPAGTQFIRAVAVGAGGGADAQYGTSPLALGAGGGFMAALLAVEAEEDLTVIIGSGGNYAPSDYLFGGSSLGSVHAYGGGYAGLFRDTTPLLIAGGGGGSFSSDPGSVPYSGRGGYPSGGAGGYLAGSTPVSTSAGGTQSSGAGSLIGGNASWAGGGAGYQGGLGSSSPGGGAGGSGYADPAATHVRSAGAATGRGPANSAELAALGLTGGYGGSAVGNGSGVTRINATHAGLVIEAYSADPYAFGLLTV